MHHLFILTASYQVVELPPGQLRPKVHERSATIKALWDQLTPEERLACVHDKMEELESQREAKQHALQNVPINAFHDARATIAHIQSTVSYHSFRMISWKTVCGT